MVQIEPTPYTNERSSPSAFLADRLAPHRRVIIAVLGQTGTGKTTFINTASGSNLTIGKGLESCTIEVQESDEFELDGRSVTLIDTPGFDDSDRSDVDILRMIADYLGKRYKEGVTLAGVIYMHRISDIRMTGTSKRNFKMFRELCGENALKNVVIVTNMWGKVEKEEGEFRERQMQDKDEFFKSVLEKGGKMSRHEHRDDQNSAHKILRAIVENHPLPLQIQQELVDQEKPLLETSAGQEVDRELMAQVEKHKKEIRDLQKELQDAKEAIDPEMKRGLEEELEKHKRQIRKLAAEQRKLTESKFSWILGGAAAVGGIGILLMASGIVVPATGAAGAVAATAARTVAGSKGAEALMNLFSAFN